MGDWTVAGDRHTMFLTSMDLAALALGLYFMPTLLLSLWHDLRGTYPDEQGRPHWDTRLDI